MGETVSGLFRFHQSALPSFIPFHFPHQRRLRECALRSKLWIELSKGVNRPDGAILDLSFYKQRNLPLELTVDEVQILNALEWQSYLHAPDKEKGESFRTATFILTAIRSQNPIARGLTSAEPPYHWIN
jgi:hypothetical protein